MELFFAPMEGLTDYIYRSLHCRYFGGLDGYYMPFLSPTVHRKLTAREERELPPADTLGFVAVPQLLTHEPSDFLWMAAQCAARGYGEVNLNLGCPSGTVVSKGKGAGMLRDLDGLRRFLDEVCAQTPVPVSVKTRLGLTSLENWETLLSIFNQYPLRRLIIHPRLRSEFYAGPLHLDRFQYAAEYSKNPLCFNGELRSRQDIFEVQAAFPQVSAVMLGRGLIARPDLFAPADNAKLEQFLDELLEQYTRHFGGPKNAMFRMKEQWQYLLPTFSDSEKLGKQLRKTTDLAQYRAITHEILRLPRGIAASAFSPPHRHTP